MRIKELFEYRKASRPSSVEESQIESYLQIAEKVSSFKSKTKIIELNQYNFDSRNICFIGTFKGDIICYIILQKYRDKFWKVIDVDVYKDFRQDGIALGLYLCLIELGYSLMNGASLSAEIEGLWLKLPKFTKVQTYDVVADKLQLYDMSPKNEKQWDDEQQQFYWIASK